MSHPISTRRALALTAVLGCLLSVGQAGPLAAEELTLDRRDASLSGTLLLPEQTEEVAVILPGSGPTDRDGTAPAGLNSNAYRLLAEALALEQVATLRADKRGVGRSTGDGNAVTLALYAGDTGAWIDLLRARTGQACVWLIGHSEGGLVALRTATQRDDICGLILLATPGRPISQILLEQLRGAPALAPHLPMAEKAILSLIAGQPVPPENLPGPLIGIFAPPVQPFLIDLFSVDPAQQARKIGLPALVVSGTADLQINAEDARLLSDALSQGELFELENMTHMLKTAQDNTRSGNLATYADPTIPLTEGLVDRIATFIRDPR